MTLSEEQIGSMGDGLQALRALRLLRVIKLARSWTKLQDILSKTIKSLKDISNFSVLLFLFMYIYALLGMELFANKVRYDLEDQVIGDIIEATKNGDILITPRMNFDNIQNSLTTIFCEILGEDWNVYLYTYVRPQDTGGKYMVLAYFLSLMVMGNIMLLSLFTAILLQNFEDDGSEGDEPKEKFNIKQVFTRASLLKAKDGFMGVFGAKKKKTSLESVSPRQVAADKSASQIISASPQSGVDKAGKTPPDKSYSEKVKIKLDNITEVEKSQENEGQDEFNLPAPDEFSSELAPPQKNKSNGQHSERRKQRMKKAQSVSMMHNEATEKSKTNDDADVSLLKDVNVGYALFIFGPENRIRIFANLIYSHPYFDRFILSLIGISTLTLAFESPLDDPKGTKVKVLEYIDYVMSSFFFCECITKLVALGFVGCGPKSYIRNPWNILDFTIVCSAFISMVFSNINLKAIKSLRILRVLRPLRLVSKNRGLKLAITSLFNSLPNIANLLLIVVFFIFLLSILCMTLFSGKFYYCEGEHLTLGYKQ